MFVAIFVVSIVAIIMFHEFGHFATAKLFGMKCERFFLGFGPTLWSVRRGETEYGVGVGFYPLEFSGYRCPHHFARVG